jgi:dTDP-glucose 4,6-dehydratase
MARLLVTGGAGFIGSNFVMHWLREHPGDRVVVLDALTYAGNAANLESLSDRAEFRLVHGDICDGALVEELLRSEKLDTLVHFAAESHVDRSIHAPDAFITTNVIGTHTLLKAARKLWIDEKLVPVHRFHHVSTDEVYGSLGPNDPSFHEETQYSPNSPYSASKAASDHLVRAYHHTFGLQVTTSNCSNNYGPLHFPEKLIPLMIINILEGRRLPVYGDGRNVRDWLFVEDHCRAIERVLLQGRSGETYNVGGLCEVENIELVKRLCDLADRLFAARPELRARFPKCPSGQGGSAADLISYVKDRPGHDRRYAIDCGKIARELGFTPSVKIEQGLPRTFEWYLENEGWWRAVMDGSYREWISTNYRA